MESELKNVLSLICFIILYCFFFFSGILVCLPLIRIFIDLTFRMLFNLHFQKWSKVTVKENDATIYSKIARGLRMRLRI